MSGRPGGRDAANAVRAAACAVLLVGPVVLAFRTGGGPDVPRLVAAIVAWALVAIGALTARSAVPRAGWVATGGLLALAALSLASSSWAPVPDAALDAAQRAALYVGVLLAALLLAPRRTEAAVLAGCLVVCSYALGDRLLPGLLEFDASRTAQGRLEQPLTYWNALGALAALGVVLAARAAAGSAWAVAAAAPLLLALGLTASRGAAFALGAGLLALVVAARDRRQVAAIALVLASGLPAVAAGLALAAVARRADGGDPAAGLAVLALLAAGAAAGAALHRRLPAAGPLRLPPGAPWIVLAVVLGALAVAAGWGERDPGRADASRLADLGSNRYDYWDVAVRAFADEPLRGVGAGGWASEWLRERPYPEGVRDAHSLPLQTAAELGVLGLLALGATLAAIAGAARRASPGTIGGLSALGAHHALDWDWQLPAATLPAVLLAAAALRAPRRSGAPPAGTPPPP